MPTTTATRARREVGSGSIFPVTIKLPDGTERQRWRAQLSIGPRSDRRYATRTVKTYAEARRQLGDLREEHAGGANVTKLSLGEYLQRWLHDSAKPSVSANTWRGYNDVVTHHMKPIAGIPLVQLTAEDIERALAAMTTHRHNAKSQKAAAPATVRNAQIVLRMALAQAEQRGHVRRNVAKQVPLRRIPKRNRDAMTPELARQILAATAGDQHEAAFAVALMGLRASELLGLRRSDIHLDRKPASIDIRVQLVGSGPKAKLTPVLKTDASWGTLPLPSFVADRLHKHLEEQPATLGDSLAFTTRDGYAINGSWLTKRFASLMVAAGLPRMTLHGCRHGLASILAGLNVHPKIAQALLRHASEQTTIAIYTHVSTAQVEGAVEQYDQAVAG